MNWIRKHAILAVTHSDIRELTEDSFGNVYDPSYVLGVVLNTENDHHRTYIQGLMDVENDEMSRENHPFYHDCEENLPCFGMPKEVGIYRCTLEFYSNIPASRDWFDDSEYDIHFIVTNAEKILDLPIGKSVGG